MSTTGRRLRSLWRRLSKVPGGRLAFGIILGRMVPYTATIRPRVTLLEPGHSRVQIRGRRRVRNHLHSVHALALANLGELASGLAMATALPDDVRGIPIRIEIDYIKKARGLIMAEGRAAPPDAVREDQSSIATAEIRDAAGDIVARMSVTWHLSPT